jgi:hypothetical protein
MSKVDFKKTLKSLYNPPKEFVLVHVPEMKFLQIHGQGDPNTAQEYQDAVEALYAVAYKLKFLSKNELDRDYVVPPLEGLWWADDMASFTHSLEKEKWKWRMMIMTPEWISDGMYKEVISQVLQGKNLASLEKISLESYNEGLCVQVMHIGSYDDEAPTLYRLHNEYLPEKGLIENGLHHEIYLSDPRRVKAEKLKTILRQPVRSIVDE